MVEDRVFRYALLLGLATVLGSGAIAHDSPDHGQKSLPAIRTDSPPTIDGKLDEAIWERAPRAGWFHPAPDDPVALPPWWHEDTEGPVYSARSPWTSDFVDTSRETIADDQTEVRLVYDDSFIYVAAIMYQDMSKLNATERKYDRLQLRFEDYFQVNLDTFHDHGRAYIFLVSPLGIRWDSRDGLFDRNASWDTDWRAQTQILEDRWIVEMAIPIGVMHHNRKDDVTWGLNFRRRISLENESTHWQFTPNAGVPGRAQGPKFVADFGHLEGLDLSNSTVSRAPEIEQYVSTNVRRRPGSDDVHTLFSTGIDVNLRLNSNWITTFAANPDFAEVAADEGDIENRDTQRFLEERRNFFKEGGELFRTPINIYDSRAIFDFDGAAKITGTGSDWTMASLVLHGEGADTGEDANIAVTRYSYSVNQDLQLGAMVVGVDRQDGYNAVLGADARAEVGRTSTWTTQYLYMIDEGRDDFQRVPGNDRRIGEHGFISILEGGDRPWSYRLDFRDISAEFDPDLSFVPRKDIIGPTLNFGYRDDYDHPIVEGARGFFEYEYYQNHDGKTVLRDYFFETQIEFQNNWDFQVSLREDFHDPFDNRTNTIGFEYNREDRYKSYEVDYSWGTFEDVDFTQVRWSKPFQFTDRWTNEFRGTYRQDNPRDSGTEDIWLARYETEYTFPWDGRVKLTWEEGSDESHLRTLLFAYEDVGNWDFYLVANDIRSVDDDGTEDEKLEFITKFVYRWKPGKNAF